jgi:hypothetical protein
LLGDGRDALPCGRAPSATVPAQSPIAPLQSGQIAYTDAQWRAMNMPQT